MSDPVDELRAARVALLADAEACRSLMSRLAWEERVDQLEIGKLCGPREIEAVGALVFGKRRGGILGKR